MSLQEQELAQFHNVWVYCELRGGHFIPADFELVSEARRLADDLQEKVCCLVVGEHFLQPLQILGGYGADQVLACRVSTLSGYTTEPYAQIVCDVIEKHKPRIFLFPATLQGRDLAPRCAARVCTGLTANCSRLDVSSEKYAAYLAEQAGISLSPEEMEADHGELKMTRPAFGNHLMATITCPHSRPSMCTVRPGVLVCAAYRPEREANCLVEVQACETPDTRVRILELLTEVQESASLEGAQCIVCVGRGLATAPEKGMELAGKLATLLGAQLAGSRAAIDAGWLEESRLVGQTGKTVRPRLYVAIGVSGAMQHLIGMQKSGSVLAINKDADAPIFSVADYGMVGDLYTILPILIEELEKAGVNSEGGISNDG